MTKPFPSGQVQSRSDERLLRSLETEAFDQGLGRLEAPGFFDSMRMVL